MLSKRNDRKYLLQRSKDLFLFLCLFLLGVEGRTQAIRDPNLSENAATNHFVAVHGQRSVIMGYPSQGLEVWGYPFQMLSGYRVGFRPVGTSTETDGGALLRRVDYRPDSVVRIYIGPNYLVRARQQCRQRLE